MRIYFKAFTNRRTFKGNVYLNYDTEKKLYTTGQIDGVDYEKIKISELNETLYDLRLRGYKAGISLEDDPDEIPFS